MKYTVIVSNAGIETFDNIRAQIENKWGAKHADRFEQRVVNVLDLISSSPFAFKSLAIEQNIRKGFIHRNCSMFYEVQRANYYRIVFLG
jgi:plasmid stabilization system protein ParE